MIQGCQLFMLIIHETLLFQPEQTVARPRMRIRKWGFVFQSHAMPAFLVDVQVKRHVIFPQRLGEQQAVFHRHGFILERGPEETRRRVRRHLQFVGKQLDQFWQRPFT